MVPLFFYAYTPDDAYMFAANALDVVRVLGAIVAALLVGDVVCGEFERKDKPRIVPDTSKTVFNLPG